MKNISIIIGLCLLLTSCRVVTILPNDSNSACDSQYHYCLNLNSFAEKKEWTNNWTDLAGKPTTHTISNGFPAEEDSYFRADFYNLERPCSSSITGASKISLMSKNAQWGKMDFYKDRGMEGWEPSSDESLLLCHGGGTPPVESVYTFCSEKSGKTVVICISQMKDDPEMAKRIFESFRWTE